MKLTANALLSRGLPLLLLAGQGALAVECRNRTFGSCQDGIVHWYDQDDGQICDPLDCGGGRAPPKTNRPGCPQYKGTEVYRTEASYMPCFTAPGASVAPPAVTLVTSTTTVSPPAQPVSTSFNSGPTSVTSKIDAGGSVENSSSSGSSSTADAGESSTTPAPSLPPAASNSDGAGSAGSTSSTGSAAGGRSSSSSTTSTSIQTAGANNVLGSSLAALVGVAMGAVALL